MAVLGRVDLGTTMDLDIFTGLRGALWLHFRAKSFACGGSGSTSHRDAGRIKRSRNLADASEAAKFK